MVGHSLLEEKEPLITGGEQKEAKQLGNNSGDKNGDNLGGPAMPIPVVEQEKEPCSTGGDGEGEVVRTRYGRISRPVHRLQLKF